jgi:hypothetical protein
MKNAIIIILCFVFIYSNAQDKKLIFSIDGGVSQPLGQYASKDQSGLPASSIIEGNSENMNGYALTGYCFNVSITYKFNHSIGLIAKTEIDINSFDVNTFNSQITSYWNTCSTPQLANYSVITQYHVYSYQLGLCGTIPLNNKLSLEAKTLVGYSTANFPTLTFLYNWNKDPLQSTYSLQNGKGFSYCIGIGTVYTIGRIGIHFDINYNKAYIKYKSSFVQGTAYTPGITPKELNEGYSGSGVTLCVPSIQGTIGISIGIF